MRKQNEPQRKEKAVKGSTINVAQHLTEVVSGVSNKTVNIIYKAHINLYTIALTQENGINRRYFEEIYLANEETLSSQFKHITTEDLNRVKCSLIDSLHTFNQTILQNKSSEFRKKLDKKGILNDFELVIAQTRNMITCAKTLSAVLATVAVEADLVAQLGMAEDLSIKRVMWNFLGNLTTIVSNPEIITVDSAADLFAEKLPATLGKALHGVSWGSHLNEVGSAFQLEQAREVFITKLEAYLASRASLKTVDRYDDRIIYNYRPINKGIFFNKALQEARIQVAATLLAELKFMQLCGKDSGHHKGAIDNPRYLAVALSHATEMNNNAYKTLARTLPGGNFIDGEGELAGILEEMRQEMKAIYPLDVRIQGANIGLYEQLGMATSPQP
ncbi:hypothetical protein [Legionella clemsonensis]|nr:hypothetical protein [Legionella clemsonensis]